MRFSNTRRRLPALAITALFHVLVIFVLLHAVSVETVPRAAPSAHETQITLLPAIVPSPPDKKRTRRRAASGSNAITTYFNPYTAPLFVPQAKVLGLQTALSACAPESYDMASEQIRRICGRIGALLQNDPGHFGVMQDVADPKHWQTELARREAPYLVPCANPHGIGIGLDTLLCIYDVLMHGYDPEKPARYSE